MPSPTLPTSAVYAKANKVVKLEYLPIPNITADFHVNHNTEVLLGMLRDLWEVMGVAVLSGLTISYSAPNWTVATGRLVVDGYDITLAAPFVFTALGADQEVVLRVTETLLTYETDPGTIGFIPTGFSTTKAGANQYRYSAILVRQAVGTATPAPASPQTKIKDFRLFRIDASGLVVTEQRKVLPAALRAEVESILDTLTTLNINFAALQSTVTALQVAFAAFVASAVPAATTTTLGGFKSSIAPPNPASPVAPVLDAAGVAIAQGVSRQGIGAGALALGTQANDTSVAVGSSTATAVTLEATGGTTGAAIVKNDTDVVSTAGTVALDVKQKNGGSTLDILKVLGAGGLLLPIRNAAMPVPATDQGILYFEDNGVASPNRTLRLCLSVPQIQGVVLWESDPF